MRSTTARTAPTVRTDRSLLSDATYGMLGAAGGTAISGIASIVIARELGVTARGRWAVISSLAVLIATLASAGLPAAAAYGAARLRARERNRLIQSAMVAAAALAALAAAVYLAVAAVIRPPAETIAVVCGCAIPAATVLASVAQQLTLTVVSVARLAAAQLSRSIFMLVAVVALGVTAHLTVLEVVVLSAAAQLVSASVAFVGLAHRGAFSQRLAGGLTATAHVLRPYIGYALLTFATLSLTQIVQRFDVLLVNGYRGPHAAGLYAVAVQFTDLLLVIPAALGSVMFRRGARSTPSHWSDMLVVLRWTGLFAAAGSIFVLVAAPWLVSVLFGSAYAGSVAPLRWLLPGTIAFSLQSVLSNYLAGRGRPRIVLLAWLAGAVVGIGADLVVIPAYGIEGAAIVSSVSYLLVTALHVKALIAARPAGRSMDR